MAKEPILDAADVLNWEYMASLGKEHGFVRDGRDGIELFAYDFTGTANVEDQNTMLTELLKKVTFGHSTESNEAVLKWIAEQLYSDLEKLRQVAKQRGIRLQRS